MSSQKIQNICTDWFKHCFGGGVRINFLKKTMGHKEDKRLSSFCLNPIQNSSSSSVVSGSLWPHGPQHARPPCPSPTPGVHPNSCPWSRWCHPTISSSVSPSPPAFNLSQHQGLFKWVKFFESGGQSIGVSASASVLPTNIQDWFPLGWTGLISVHSKGLSRVFFNTTVQKHQFFGAQLSL